PQPIELDRADSPFLDSEVHTTPEHLRHPAVAYATAGCVGAAKQSVRKRREVIFVGRDHGSKRVGIERAVVIDSAEIRGSAQPASDVHVRGCVPAVPMSAPVRSGVLKTAVDFRPRYFLSH